MTDAPTYIVRGPGDHMELLDSRPKWDLLPGQSVWIANVNGGDSRRIAGHERSAEPSFEELARRVADLAEWNEGTYWALRTSVGGIDTDEEEPDWKVAVLYADRNHTGDDYDPPYEGCAGMGDTLELAARACLHALTEQVGNLWHEEVAP